MKREEAPAEAPAPVPVEAIGLTPKKIAPVVHTEEKKVKRDEMPAIGLTPKKLIPRQAVDGLDPLM